MSNIKAVEAEGAMAEGAQQGIQIKCWAEYLSEITENLDLTVNDEMEEVDEAALALAEREESEMRFSARWEETRLYRLQAAARAKRQHASEQVGEDVQGHHKLQ